MANIWEKAKFNNGGKFEFRSYYYYIDHLKYLIKKKWFQKNTLNVTFRYEEKLILAPRLQTSKPGSPCSEVSMSLYTYDT